MPTMGFMRSLMKAWGRVVGVFIGSSQIVQDLRTRNAQLASEVSTLAAQAAQWQGQAQDLEDERRERTERHLADVERLERLASEQKRELDIIAEIQAVTQEKFSDFIDRAIRLIDVNRVILASVQGRGLEMIHVLCRNVHTIKAGARTHGLLNLINLVHEAEQAYGDLLKQGDTRWQAETLLAQLDGVRGMVDTYVRINEQVLGRKGPGRRGSVERYVMVERDQVVSSLHMLSAVDTSDVVAMRGALSQIGLTLNLIGTERLEDVLAGVIDALPTLARELGKVPPIVRINDQQIVVRNQISPLLKNLFTHLLHNALDHGLETAEERLAQGESAAGKITIDMALDENKLWINLRDDGRGLAIGRIRSRALALNLLSQADAGSPQLVAQTIFHAGLSTADRVTDVSGRGVGMDAVKGFLDKEGGNIVVHFLDDRHGADYRSFELIIGLPAKFATMADLKHPFLNKEGWAQQTG
jgi:two-component system chemotaxis sensor kinase CheA